MYVHEFVKMLTLASLPALVAAQWLSALSSVTLGAVVLASARADGRSPLEVSELSARFSAPVLPGERITLTGRVGGDVTTYSATVDGTGPVLSGTLCLP